MTDPMAEDDSKLDLLLEKYKDYVLGSQNVYFTGSKLALDKKETKAAISAYTTNKIIEELENVDVWTSNAEVHSTLVQGKNAYLISHKVADNDLRHSHSTIKDRIAELRKTL